MKVYLVWNDDTAEGMVFSDQDNAKYAATGLAVKPEVSAMADDFRNNVCDRDVFDIKAIEIPV